MNPPIAIAGATGFVGRALIDALGDRHPIFALSRSQKKSTPGSLVEWRQADFFSIESLTEALRGARVAVYLIHSMLPTARLDQSRFEDTDLWLSDTFAQAAARAGVERIIYLGGLVPENERISLHLQSRKEVEDALASTGIPVVTLRAGLILGAEGSSFQMLYLLVRRLPWMLCPKWAWTRTQPVSVRDVVRLLQYCIEHPEVASGSYDIGGPDVTTYRDLMLECARLLGVKRRIVNVPWFTPGLSTLWVCLITGASQKLVAPLVRSLVHPMLVRDRRLLEAIGMPLESMSQALGHALREASPQLGRETSSRRQARSQERGVRSIQRLALGSSWTATQMAEDYFEWVERVLSPWIRINREKREQVQFCLRFWRWQWVLLQLDRRAQFSKTSVESFQVTGGILARVTSPGVFEFRVAHNDGYALVGLHGFEPRLPWLIYKYSQAIAHHFIMNAFARFMKRRVRA